MIAQTASQYSQFGDLAQKLTEENPRRINFKRFSRTYHPEITYYDFRIEALLEQIQE